MRIGEQLRAVRISMKLTQEQVAEDIHVSRQTISNWENNRSYPDIISVIKLSDLYMISLDQLLKGDQDMIKHLNESTDIVSSNKKLIIICLANVFLFLFMILCNKMIASNTIVMGCVMIAAVLCMTTLFYQIIRKF